LELQIEFYANSLPASISMFAKRVGRNTLELNLALNFEYAKKIDL
jgi:hypothetical protein